MNFQPTSQLSSGSIPLTQLLARAAAGDARATDDLFARVYDEMKAMARRQLAGERVGHTLQATALVHEVYMRLVDGNGMVCFASRSHFFHTAALAIRQVLVEYARARARLKRGGEWRRVPLQDLRGLADISGADIDPLELLALHEAIARLEAENEEVGAVVRLRFFGGLTIQETAETLQLSASTVNRLWNFGRAWLFRALSDPRNSEPNRLSLHDADRLSE